MNYIAATATFGLVFTLAYWLATKLLERRVSVMERIGGGGVRYISEGMYTPEEFVAAVHKATPYTDDPMRIRCARCGVIEELNPIEEHEEWVGHTFKPVALRDSEVQEWLRLHWADA